MEKIFIFFVLFIYTYSLEPQPLNDLDIDISKFEVASKTNQIILVIPRNYNASNATLYFYVKNDNKWVKHTETDAYIGRNGLGKLKEGDKKTPVGVYKFNRYFGINPNPGTELPYIQVNESHYWDGDSKSKNYNTLVNYDIYKDFNTFDSEHLIDYNPGYEYALNIDYNKEQTPYKGAGIFLHCFTNNTYTAGCVAIKNTTLEHLYTIINEDCHIIIDTKENMTRYYYNHSLLLYINIKMFMFIFFLLLL